MNERSNDGVRLDKWLWAARFYKTRSLAAHAIEAGRVHVNGVAAKASRNLKPGDLVMLRQPPSHRTVEVLALSQVRGSAPQAQLLYAETPQSLQGTIEPDVDWANAAEARVIAELAGEAVEEEVFNQAKEAFREPNFTAAPQQAAPEVLFDEDVLRAMVQAIFREEMAGPLGERITRNIRKLVRAEVGRMLAAHELE